MLGRERNHQLVPIDEFLRKVISVGSRNRAIKAKVDSTLLESVQLFGRIHFDQINADGRVLAMEFVDESGKKGGRRRSKKTDAKSTCLTTGGALRMGKRFGGLREKSFRLIIKSLTARRGFDFPLGPPEH